MVDQVANIHAICPPPQDSNVCTVVGRDYPQITAGEYSASFLHHETSARFGGKLFMWFRIHDPGGPFNGVQVFKAYNVKGLKGRAGMNGKFIVGKRSYFVKDCTRLFTTGHGKYSPRPADFRNKLFLVNIREVSTNERQQEYDEAERYSVVDRILEVQAGG